MRITREGRAAIAMSRAIRIRESIGRWNYVRNAMMTCRH